MKKLLLLIGFALSLTMNGQVTADVEHSFGAFKGAGFNGTVNSITLQSDQKFIVGGDFTSFNSQTVNRLLRYTSECAIDNTFSIGSGFDNGVTTVAIQTDGKILVGGDFASCNGTTKNKIVRLNSNGSIDTSFLIGIGFNNSVKKIIVQPDGKILVGGYFTSYNGTTQNALVRLNTNGSVDGSFVSSLGSGSQTNDIALQSNGKIVVAGGFIKRLNTNGTQDNTLSYLSQCGGVQKIAIQQDGTIWAGGDFTNLNYIQGLLGLIRITPNGTILPVPFFSSSNPTALNCLTQRTVSLLSIQPDGKIYISANQNVANQNPLGGAPIYTFSRASGRFNSDYSIDFMYVNLIGGDINAAAVQPDGKILVGGNYTSYNNNTNNAILLRLYGSTETGGFCQTMPFSNLNNMPTSRGLIASATDGSNIYVCNGFSPTVNYTTQIEKYNTATNVWSTFSNTSSGLRYPSAEIVGNKLYVFNGIPDATTFNNKMEVIDLFTGAVNYSTVNPSPVRSAGSSVWNGKIYSFGGRDSAGYSNKLYVFDPVLQTWTALANMPQAKEAKGEIINGKLYVIGGFNSSMPNYSTSIDCYDIQTNTWSHLMDMPASNSASGTSAYQNKIWVIGDYDNLTFVGYYDVLTNQFVSIQSNTIGRRHASAIALNNNLYTFGGNQTSFADSCLNSLQVTNITNFTNVPNVGYVTPQTYVIGTSITPLTPINTSGSCSLTYSISPALPSGLTLDTATGIISGATVVTLPVTSYSITACNSSVCVTSTLVLSTTTLPPSISYTSPQTYTIGTSITPIMPLNKGGFVPSTLYREVTTLAGSGTTGSTDGIATSATFNGPSDITVDVSGNLYVADSGNNKIRKISPSGTVTTLAGSGAAGSTNGVGSAASFYVPSDIAVDGYGNVYVADSGNNKIRRITPSGIVTTLAGSGAAGSADGFGSAATFNTPYGVEVDISGNVYVGDFGSNKIRKITPSGFVTTLAGSGAAGSNDGTSMVATFNGPRGIAVDALGNVYVGDSTNNKIRKITPAGTVTTLAGSGAAGSTDGSGTSASFNSPRRVAVDDLGNVYVADTNNSKIRKISPSGDVTSLAGSGIIGSTDGTSNLASFNLPRTVAVDASRNVYVGDFSNNKIRKITQQGYAISPNLPAGLNIDGTGTVSGTPTAITALTTYTITAYNTAGSSSTKVVLSTTTLGTVEFFNTSLKLYPNPTRSLIHIQTSNNVVLDKIIITDLAGKTVMEQTQNTNQVSVEKLATGVYILNGYSEGGKFQEKFIKE